MSEDKELQAITLSARKGKRYEVEIPDTLDLAERARVALNGLSGVLDPEFNYEMYFIIRFHSPSEIV